MRSQVEGKIVALVDKDNNHVADDQKVLASGLNRPHGFLEIRIFVFNSEDSIHANDAQAR